MAGLWAIVALGFSSVGALGPTWKHPTKTKNIKNRKFAGAELFAARPSNSKAKAQTIVKKTRFAGEWLFAGEGFRVYGAHLVGFNERPSLVGGVLD